MEKLNLNQTWELGEPLDSDPGGFGRVFLARSPEGEEVVAKLVRKEPGAEREMLFDGVGKPNVVPILDSGEHGDDWVIIMPRAQKSLRRHLEDSGGKLPLAECVQVLTDIATALDGLDGDIVHRDLKPENVLLLNGIWCLADFGLARYAEAATAAGLYTRKDAGTGPYVPPERWRMERATTASDVFAFGVIGFEIFSGSWPFPGLDFRHQILHDNAPRLADAPPLYASLIGACLYRAPQARPTPADLVTRLATLGGPPLAGGLAALAQANSEQVTRTAAAQQQESQQRTEADRRGDLLEAAEESLEVISDTVLAALATAAPAGQVTRRQHGGWSFALGGAELTFDQADGMLPQSWTGGGSARFDVIAHTSITLSVPPSRSGYQGRSHSLWFCDAQTAEQYGWFETAFRESSFGGQRQPRPTAPFALPPDADARAAMNSGMHATQLAWPFTRLEPADLDDFISRWADWLARAADGQLAFPPSMPERHTQGSHR
ncbi:serine/threonine-protein kinase [Kitasatospora sp. NPDC059408]|uniref:serine/threonine-protein kinase n=1 Tax=Kitasatospora sp. NPDC059408 TaxID=3346823 RepID=UPI0036BC8CAC